LKSLFAGFFVILLISLSGCRTVEVSVQAPAGVSRVDMGISLHGRAYDIRVFFPDGRQGTAQYAKISFLPKNESSRDPDFPYAVGTPYNSLYEAAAYEIRERGKVPSVDILLVENQLILSKYKSPEVIGFSAGDSFLNVGRLVGINRTLGIATSSSHCNGVLVGDDLVLTNYHCIDDQAECDKATFILSSEKAGEAITCKDFVHGEEFHDQALVRLKSKVSSPFKPARVERTRFVYTPGTSMALVSTFGRWHKSFLTGSWNVYGEAKMQSQRCSIIELHSYIGELNKEGIEAAISKRSLTLLTYSLDCSVEHGQSGSPVYNLDGVVAGILWGKLSRMEGDEVEKVDGLFTLLHPEILARIP